MQITLAPLFLMLVQHVIPVFATGQLGFLEGLVVSINQRPWLLGLYVFVVGLPMILFISFMWPDKRFGPPDQPYYYKKSDDAQPDDPEVSLLKGSADTKVSQSSRGNKEEDAPSTHKRMPRKQL
ncbi:calmegin-like [Cololabis saira]|uniref:calmegin-like n=1 Tax=Cololabis saira TaxID=129043 RepID=UPI002AD2E724|nr:calmegin-like [Cololabis saira]